MESNGGGWDGIGGGVGGEVLRGAAKQKVGKRGKNEHGCPAGRRRAFRKWRGKEGEKMRGGCWQPLTLLECARACFWGSGMGGCDSQCSWGEERTGRGRMKGEKNEGNAVSLREREREREREGPLCPPETRKGRIRGSQQQTLTESEGERESSREEERRAELTRKAAPRRSQGLLTGGTRERRRGEGDEGGGVERERERVERERERERWWVGGSKAGRRKGTAASLSIEGGVVNDRLSNQSQRGNGNRSSGLKIEGRGGMVVGVCLCGIRPGLACMTRATRKFPVSEGSFSEAGPCPETVAGRQAGRETDWTGPGGERAYFLSSCSNVTSSPSAVSRPSHTSRKAPAILPPHLEYFLLLCDVVGRNSLHTSPGSDMPLTVVCTLAVTRIT
ncbi:hypothetical protein JZ751_024474 [Albula glossodonta]|uniref:Uncharacterized protein n=1 Tax=Albula glossodonta TaxID=121402 RepID=A0A8T2PDH4_9TELE|nr:hypothetical protein JZ751_024474 [Albula glossodonta]